MKKLLVQEEMQVAREEQIKHKLHFQAIQGNTSLSSQILFIWTITITVKISRGD